MNPVDANIKRKAERASRERGVVHASSGLTPRSDGWFDVYVVRVYQDGEHKLTKERLSIKHTRNTEEPTDAP